MATNDGTRSDSFISDLSRLGVTDFTDGSEVVLEAFKLINGKRQADYSHPLSDYTKVRDLFEFVAGVSLTVEQAILFMVCVKLARLRTNLDKGVLHHDSLVDAIGYLGCLSMAIHKKTVQHGNS